MSFADKVIVIGSNGEGDKPPVPEPKKLTTRQRGMMAAGAGMAIAFLLGAMVPRETSQPAPTPNVTTTTTTERGPDARIFNDYLAERVVKGRILAHRKLTYFLGHVEISFGKQPPKTVVNPIILTDADLFYPGRSHKPGQTNSQYPGDFDFKVYAVPHVAPQEENWGDYGEGLDIYTDFLDESTSFQFFDVDGQPIEMPESLLPQSESPFLQHVVYAEDLALGSTHDADGTHYNIHAADGTQISFPAN